MGGGSARRGLGDILRERRLGAGINERAMSLALRRSSSFVRAYERGKVSLTIEELENVAAILGTQLSELVAEYDNVKNQ